MLEHIWSGWRATYVQSAPVRAADAGVDRGDPDAPQASVFTQLLQSGEPDAETHIVHRGDTCFALMNAFPYTSGHLLVVPYREVPDLADLDDGEILDLWHTVTEAIAVVRAAYEPDGMNVGVNLGRPAGGSVPTHLHVHVVPRWTGDSNFMSAVANTQTLPEGLESSAERIRRAWAQRHRAG
ncbi:MAG: HIT domain-containing protein [Actinomycetota bacterium]